jgi:hypothetical protein
MMPKRRSKGNKSNMSRASPKAGGIIEVGGGNVHLTKIEAKPLTGVLSPRPETSYFPPRTSNMPFRPVPGPLGINNPHITLSSNPN